ncbi:MAG: PAS domain S-box protein [Candidatus Bathyarchaeota archaeon]
MTKVNLEPPTVDHKKSGEESPIHVLHVDDEAAFLKCAKPILEMQGNFAVETASSVEEAMEKMEKKTFDVIVSDYIMPGKDGLEFLKELRDSGNSIPFIIFTGKGREIVAIKALNLGANQYINKIGKPETVYSELAHGIRTVVKIKQAKEALQKSEEKYRSLFENARDVTLTLDLKGNVTSINKAAMEYGFKKDEVIGKNMRKFVFKKYWPKLLKNLVQLAQGKTVEGKIEITTPKGNKNAEYTSNPIIIDNKVVGVQAVLRDITERKQMEKQLKDSEEKYRKQFEKALDAIFLADAETGIIVGCNRAATKLVGRKKSELIGKHQRILHPPEAIEGEFSRTFEQHRKEKEAQVLEDQIITKNGEIRDVIINATTFELEGKTLLEGTFRDITERKRVEAELRREKELMEMVTANNAAALVIISKDFRILWANKFLTDFLGDIRGKVCYSTLNNLTNVCPGCGVKEILETGKNKVVHEQVVPGLNGQKVWLQITVIPIRNKNGNLIAISEMAIDITERKKAEEALRDSDKEKSAVLDSMSELVVHQDLEHRVLWANRQATISAGISAEQFQGSYCHEIWANSANPCTGCPVEETIKTGQPQQGEITTPDGRVWSISGYPIKDANGNTTSIVEVATEITEQKKTEEALRESEEKFRELLNGMNDTVWVIDFDGNIIDVNDAAVEVLGYSREEFHSMGLTGIDSNLDPEKIKGLVEGMPADEVQVFETAHTTKDGKKIPVEISSSLVTYHGKQAILSIARDITERKRAREKLRQSEERYRTVFEHTGTAMCILEEDKTISMVNRRFEELSGYSWKELEGKKWTELVTKEYLERMKRYHETRRKKGGKPSTHYSFDFVNKKGQIRNCMLTVNLIPGTKKSVASILDITESKKAEKALLEADEKYRETIVNANVGIIGYSPEGEVNVLNPKMEQMTGFKRSEIPTLRAWFKKLYPNEEERRKVRDKWFKRMSEEGEVKGGHAIIVTKDGKRRNFLFNGVRLESGDFIAFAEDITERKEAEEKLDGMMNEVVAINEKLGVVGRLTRHDARNKLSVMANNVYLAKQKLAANHSSLEYLGDIESAIGQMEEIFDFARNYEMLGVEELSYVDVEKSVDEAAMLFSELNGAKLVNECQGLTVMADSLLRQLFYNLIDDTLKHGEKVSQIRVYYKKVKDQLKLVYEDDGVGIPEDEKEKIFTEGYGKGTGYGLYLIKKICEAYGWTIQETGVPGKGAQFTMTIPKMNKNGKISYIIN